MPRGQAWVEASGGCGSMRSADPVDKAWIAIGSARMHVSTIAVFLLAFPAQARSSEEVTFPIRPSSILSLTDDARVIADLERSRIREICRDLEAEMTAPLRVVTIRSMSDHGAAGWSIERFASHVFEAWNVGSIGPGEGGNWDRGVLLLVAVEDRQACVELGPEWLGHHHRRSRAIVEDLVLPELRAGRLSEGILLGVVALDALARNLPIPDREWSAATILGVSSAVGFLVAAFVSLLLHGSAGWAWSFGRFALLKPFELAEPARGSKTGTDRHEHRLSVNGGASGKW